MTNEKLEQITADNKEIEIEGQKFEINPLTVKQFTRAQLRGEKDEAKALLEMFYHSLENEDIDRDGIRNAPAKFMVKLQETIMELNDFEDFFDEEEKQEALNKLQ